ncbi:hypothetical protein GCM10027168_39530 [Streptomyces capparidis]
MALRSATVPAAAHRCRRDEQGTGGLLGDIDVGGALRVRHHRGSRGVLGLQVALDGDEVGQLAQLELSPSQFRERGSSAMTMRKRAAIAGLPIRAAYLAADRAQAGAQVT